MIIKNCDANKLFGNFLDIPILPIHTWEEAMVAERIGGGCYDAALQEIIPLNFSLVDKLWFIRQMRTWIRVGDKVAI